jgi:hypothetical protein
MTFAACVTDTVGSPVVAATDGRWAALTVGPFDSLPGVANPLGGVDGALLGAGRSAIAELGATGGTDPTEAVGEALVAAGTGEAAVDVTAGASETGGAMTRGSGDSTFVAGRLAVVVGDAGVTGVIAGALVVCVTGRGGASTGSTACCVRSCGASASSGTCAFGSGAGAVVVTT